MKPSFFQSVILLIVAVFLVLGGAATFYASQSMGGQSLGVVLLVASLLAIGAAITYLQFRNETAPIEDALGRGRTRVKDDAKVSDQDLAEHFSKDRVLSGAWQTYHQTLIKHPSTERLEARSPASEHFNVSSLLKTRVDLPVYQATSNWLIGIGIFFTFVGLTGALTAAGASFQTTDVASMKSALESLLNAASAKFITSLTGIFCSVLFSIGERSHYHNVERNIQLLCEALDTRYPAFQFEEVLLTSLNPAGGAETALKMREAVEALGAAASGLRSVTATDIGREVGASLSPIFKEISGELSTLRAIKADQGQDMLRNLIQELRDDVIIPIAKRLDENANLTREVSTAVSTLHRDLAEISARLAGASESILHFQSDTMQQLQSFAGNLQIILGHFRAETQGVLQQVATEINQALQQGIQGLSVQREAFQLSASQAAETFRGIRGELETALQTQAERETVRAREMEGRMNVLLTQFGDTFNQQTATLEAVGREAAMLMGTARDEVSAGMRDVVQMLQANRTHTEAELERFRVNYQQSLDSFFRQQNQLLEGTLGQQRDGLAAVIQDLRQTFADEVTQRRNANADFQQAMEALDSAFRSLQEFAVGIGINKTERIESLQQLAGMFGQQVDKLDAAYRGLANQIRDVMAQSDVHLTKYMQASEAKHQQFFNDYDTAVTKISDSLLQAADILLDAERERREAVKVGGA
jgi:hypothetical protein